MKFLKAGNNMLSETFGTIEDTAKMIRGAAKRVLFTPSSGRTMHERMCSQT